MGNESRRIVENGDVKTNKLNKAEKFKKYIQKT